MIKVRLVLEYDGRNFAGWQSQPNLRTVEDEVKRALTIICRAPIIGFTASGRTDSGVHAFGQVASFSVLNAESIDLWKIQNGVSHILKGDVAVVSAELVGVEFHPRKNVEYKEYRYFIETRKAPLVIYKGRAWHLPSSTLNVKKIKYEISSFIGTHDFTSFAAKDCQAKYKIKEIYSAEIVEDGTLLTVSFRGSGFLKQMVRIMVGTLVDLGCDRSSLKGRNISEILSLRDRSAAGVTAPPHGLYLYRVSYS
jgi:tRNA pseudouridine38-40 synthase